jgi:hypothetical protein
MVETGISKRLLLTSLLNINDSVLKLRKKPSSGNIVFSPFFSAAAIVSPEPEFKAQYTITKQSNAVNCNLLEGH